MLQKVLASLGQGGAQVDLVLHQEQFVVGSQVTGEIFVKGGTVEQSINYMEVRLILERYNHENEYTQTIEKIPIQHSFAILSNETKSFPFQFDLPTHFPVSGDTVCYYFETYLDIAAGKDYVDRDLILIVAPVESGSLHEIK